MDTILVENDTGSKLEVTCKDQGPATVIDLTGATVKLKYRIEDGPLETKTMALGSPTTAGKASYVFLAGELKPGKFRGEIEITDGTGKILTSLGMIEGVVRKKLG